MKANGTNLRSQVVTTALLAILAVAGTAATAQAVVRNKKPTSTITGWMASGGSQSLLERSKAGFLRTQLPKPASSSCTVGS
jgi:hypothetical protein